jgi:nodulation protein E
MIHGAGTVGTVAVVQALRTGLVHPTANYENPDPNCALDVVAGAPRQGDWQGALVNAFGFGGQNATIAVRRARGGWAA